MIKTRSASNLLDANNSTFPAIGAEGFPQSLPPLTTEKRSHAEIGDGSPQSPPPPTEKRNCVENTDQPPESECFPATTGEEDERRVGKGFDKLPVPAEKVYQKVNGRFVGERYHQLPAHAQEGYLKVMERFGSRWEELRMYEHGLRASKKQIGDIGYIFMHKHEGYGEKDYPNFKPLVNFRENQEFYHVLLGLAEKAVAYFNEKNNKKLCFEDFERVSSCQSCGGHYLLTMKAIDPLDAASVKVLRSKVLKGEVVDGNVEAEVQLCELVTLDA